MLTNISPMLSIDEYANSRFMSVWIALNTTPNSAVKSPSISMSTPHHATCRCSRSNTVRSTPYKPAFRTKPLIRADTGDGAAGCASGSQTCSGKIPAFVPKPNSASRNAMDDQNTSKCCRRMAANV
ncbi:hypothetical protein AWB68_08534 [Caballeronia choica]|uniref:Uncharacterized protein n=1 Tax=Caballeronia choica TaxID=326476 RepID=A0A158L312_9BURK|nr:hypothetical protein AWB68_08534 [Caballeronia choica]